MPSTSLRSQNARCCRPDVGSLARPTRGWLRHSLRFDVVARGRAMALNRLCEPRPELGVLRPLETVVMPKIANEVSHDHLWRAVDVGG